MVSGTRRKRAYADEVDALHPSHTLASSVYCTPEGPRGPLEVFPGGLL